MRLCWQRKRECRREDQEEEEETFRLDFRFARTQRSPIALLPGHVVQAVAAAAAAAVAVALLAATSLRTAGTSLHGLRGVGDDSSFSIYFIRRLFLLCCCCVLRLWVCSGPTRKRPVTMATNLCSWSIAAETASASAEGAAAAAAAGLKRPAASERRRQ